jgi:hypothetical protein
MAAFLQVHVAPAFSLAVASDAQLGRNSCSGVRLVAGSEAA